MSGRKRGTKKIDARHLLPCDFIVGHIRYRKGVKLETVRAAAERWLKTAVAASASSNLPALLELRKIINRMT